MTQDDGIDDDFVTVIAPTNIALVKYWGKKPHADPIANVPLAGSLSVTMHAATLRTTTTATFASSTAVNDTLALNGELPVALASRAARVVERARRAARSHEHLAHLANRRIALVSTNAVPTAAGLASSASGLAALALAVHTLLRLPNPSITDNNNNNDDDDVAVTTLARMGSGSACRSLYGGVVLWDVYGLERDAMFHDTITRCAISVVRDSHCLVAQLERETDFFCSTIDLLVLVENDERKILPSTIGMQRAVETSQLLQYRADIVVPRRLRRATQLLWTLNDNRAAIRDDATFGGWFGSAIDDDLTMVAGDTDASDTVVEDDVGRLLQMTMRDSNQMHATCLDSFPPASYMSATGNAVMRLVHGFNSAVKRELGGPVTTAAYTFDAGPNAVVLVRRTHARRLVRLIRDVMTIEDDTMGDGRDAMRGDALDWDDNDDRSLVRDADDVALCELITRDTGLDAADKGNRVLRSAFRAAPGRGAFVSRHVCDGVVVVDEHVST